MKNDDNIFHIIEKLEEEKKHYPSLYPKYSDWYEALDRAISIVKEEMKYRKGRREKRKMNKDVRV